MIPTNDPTSQDHGDHRATAPPVAVRESTAKVIELSIVSDTICPWCYIGKRRLERAIEILAADGVTVRTRWLPFELNPTMPPAGMDRRAYRSGKFGSWDSSQALDAQVAAEGAREGVVFRHELMARTPNTRASHRLIWLAGDVGGPEVQDRVVEELFSSYFSQGRDVGDPAVLADIGVDSGLPEERVLALLAGSDGMTEVLQYESWAATAGIGGVPSVLAGDHLLFSGAQSTPAIVHELHELTTTKPSAPAGPEGQQTLDART